MAVRHVPVYFEFGSFRGRGCIFLEVLITKNAPLVFLRLQSHWLVYCDSYFQLSTWGASMWPWRSSFFTGETAWLEYDNHFTKSFCVESSSVADPLKLQLRANTVACFCRILRRTSPVITECNFQVDALNTSVKWPVTCATITHRLMLVRPVQISSGQAQASL